METKTCCAYNATRSCTLSSKVTAADSEREPLKVLKVLVEGLARDSESSLWLTPLLHAPQLMRLFPFDLVYLDGDHKVIQGAALLPGVQLPQFCDQTASALILPLDTLASTKTQPGDQLMVCAEEELEARIAEISASMVVAPVTAFADAPIAATSLPFTAFPKLPPHPFPGPRISVPILASPVRQGTGFTGTMATSWQISNSTTAAVLLEPVEAQAEKAASENLSVADIAAADTESTEAQEEGVTTCPVSGPVSGPVSDRATPAEVAESARQELVPATAPSVAAEPDAVAAEPQALEERLDAVERGDQAQKPWNDVSGIPWEASPVIEWAKAPDNAHEIGTGALKPQRKERAENVPATIATSTDTDPVTAKKKSREKKKKEPLGVLVKRFLNCEDPLPERRSIIRLLLQGLIAYTANGEKTKPHEVRDVSPTGLYLRTEERWKPGDVVSLVLQGKDATEEDHERRVRVQLKAVRCDEGGVGLSWLWPQGVEFQPWKRVHTKRSYETDADYFLRELRLARALGFLRQICPPAAEEIRLALHQRLSNKRVASAVEIALKAQELLGRRDHGASKLAHPDMVRRILENGSWTVDDWIRQWWGGILVSSCSADGLDTSNSVFIDLLARLTPVHLRVLSFACRKATELIAAGEPAATLDVYCTAEELIEAVGSHSLARIQQTMGQLSSFGLLAESTKPSYIAVTDKVKTRATPTPLALKMHARCNGRR
jgi:hypothetical protein